MILSIGKRVKLHWKDGPVRSFNITDVTPSKVGVVAVPVDPVNDDEKHGFLFVVTADGLWFEVNNSFTPILAREEILTV